jgi:hydroxymethylglutaryl-CoA lyase
MSEYDIFKVNPRMPKTVKLADITIRDGLQHEESWIPTEAKIYYLQELAFAGVKRMEVTNLGNPRVMPQFKMPRRCLRGSGTTYSKNGSPNGASTPTRSSGQR